ncbi:unnamed protein product [Arctogadus glacialis]
MYVCVLRSMPGERGVGPGVASAPTEPTEGALVQRPHAETAVRWYSDHNGGIRTGGPPRSYCCLAAPAPLPADQQPDAELLLRGLETSSSLVVCLKHPTRPLSRPNPSLCSRNGKTHLRVRNASRSSRTSVLFQPLSSAPQASDGVVLSHDAPDPIAQRQRPKGIKAAATGIPMNLHEPVAGGL